MFLPAFFYGDEVELKDKKQIRQHCLQMEDVGQDSLKDAGRLAEMVRRLPGYKDAKQLFVGPAPLLQQIRINALLDNKQLIMPGPGLREGFFLLQPFSVPFKDLAHAVTYKGLARYGRRLDMNNLADFQIGFFLTDLLAVDNKGGFVGDGLGFFDLSVAVLSKIGAVAEHFSCWGVSGKMQVQAEDIDLDTWDVHLNGVVTPDKIIEFGNKLCGGQEIVWQELDQKRIKKITPLWKIFQEMNSEG